MPMPQMIEHEEAMYEVFSSAASEDTDTWQLEDSWTHLGTLIKKGVIGDGPAGVAQLERVLAYVTSHYPPKLHECVGYVLTEQHKHELSMIFENTTGVIKSCHTSAAVLRPCFQILLHLAYPPQQPCTPLLESEVNQLVATKKSITRLLRAVPGNLDDEAIVKNVLRMVLRVHQCNTRALCSLELSSVYQLPEKWSGPAAIGDPEPESTSTSALSSSDRNAGDAAESGLVEQPASKRRQQFDYYRGEVYSLSYICLAVLKQLEHSTEVVSLICQIIQALCSRSQSLYSKILAHKEEIGLISLLLTVFERYIEVFTGAATDALSGLLDDMIQTFMKLIMVCKFYHIHCKLLQENVSRLLIKTLRPCLEHKKRSGTPCMPKDTSLLSSVFRYCLHLHFQVMIQDCDVVEFAVQLVEECRTYLKPYLPSALRFAYGVGSALSQPEWVKSFRSKKEHGLHIAVMKCLEGGHVQDDSVLKEAMRLLRFLVADPQWNEDLFNHGILECLSVLASRLCCSDAYATIMLDLVRVGFQLTCCSLEKRRVFIDKKYLQVLRAALVNHVHNWSIVRCALGSLSMLFRVREVVAVAYKLNLSPVLLETVRVHSGVDAKQRYLHNVITHMACFAVPPQPRPPFTVGSLANKAQQQQQQHVQTRHYPALPQATGGGHHSAHSPVLRSRHNVPEGEWQRRAAATSTGPCHQQQAQCSPSSTPPHAPPVSSTPSVAAFAASPSPSSDESPAAAASLLTVERLHGMASHSCSTCAGPTAASLELILTAKSVSVEVYEELTMRGWFRRGSVPLSHYRHIHHPDCGDYETCTDVERFDAAASSTYKRVLKRAHKAGVTVETVRPTMDPASFDLYNRYQLAKHGKVLKAADGYCNHIVDSPLAPVTRDGVPYGTVHQLYRMNGRLIGVGVLDVLPHCLISVYMFYDVGCRDVAKLSLGVFAVLQEIDYAKRMNREHGAHIHHYMLGGFCPLNKKVSYKANYPPVRFCAPWASSLWVDELTTARLLAGLSALRQSVRQHRLVTILAFVACHGGLPAPQVSTVLHWVRGSGLTLYEVFHEVYTYDLAVKASGHEAGASDCASMSEESALGVVPDATAPALASMPDEVAPMSSSGSDDGEGMDMCGQPLLQLPDTLRSLCDRCEQMRATSDAGVAAFPKAAYPLACDVTEKLAGLVVSDPLFRCSRADGEDAATLGLLLESVFECDLRDQLADEVFSKRHGVLVSDVLEQLDACCCTALSGTVLPAMDALLVGGERSAGDVDPDYARSVSVREAYHGLCADTELRLDSIHRGLTEYQQVGGDANDIRLLVDSGGENERPVVSRISELHHWAGGGDTEWWLAARELLHQNLECLASALGPELCRRTTVSLAEVD